MLELNKIYNGDCIELMKNIDDNSIDAIVTDPPYQLDSITKRFGKKGSAEAQYGIDGAFQRVSKGFMQKEWDVLPSVETLKECLRVLKPGAFALWLMTPRQDSQLEFLLRLREAGFVIGFTSIYWAYNTGLPKALNISKAINKKLRWGEAKQFDGAFAGFQPKPAVEVIIVSMKPLSEKTYVEQALKNGHGITWLNNVRIPITGKKVIIHDTPTGTFAGGGYNKKSIKNYRDNEKGRFPANLLISDNVLDNGLKQSVGHNPNVKTTGFGKFGGGKTERVDYKNDNYIKDVGGNSRYFSLDKWWEERVKELPIEQRKTFPFLIVPKASKSERNKGLSVENKHPTLKPIKLISYLITLTTREGEVVLDPFLGSGTTAIASKLLNRSFIGFEKEEEYYRIALERIKWFESQQKLK